VNLFAEVTTRKAHVFSIYYKNFVLSFVIVNFNLNITSLLKSRL